MKVLSLLLLLTSFVVADEQTVRVVKVHDADTIVVLRNGKAETIRLNSIDCPEIGESGGKRAKKFAVQTIGGKNVVIKTHGKDQYGRTIADLYLQKGDFFNQQLVRSGNCKWGRSRAMRKDKNQDSTQ